MLERSFAIGIDVGGSSLKCGVVDSHGQLQYSFLFPLEHAGSAGEVITFILAAVRKCVSQVSGNLLGVGVGFPGIIDSNVVIGGADNLPYFVNVDLGAVIADSTGLNVIVDNDVNMMGIGEQLYGAARGYSDVVFLTVGTGIGGSLILNGKPYGGFRNRGGEIGHFPIVHNGRKCACGGLGCLESYASVGALERSYAKLRGSHAHGRTGGRGIVQAYLHGEEEALTAMDEHFEYLSSGVAGLVNIFSPQLVVIGGGITESGSFYVDEVRSRTSLKTIPVCSYYTRVVPAELGNNAGLIGCAAKVFSVFKSDLQVID